MKNLRVRSITLEKEPIVYVNYWLMLYYTSSNPLPTLFGKNILAHYAEYSKKLAQTKIVFVLESVVERGEAIISDGLAKELGVTLGNKINLKLKRYISPIDHLTLYEKNTKKFMKYFSEQPDADKKKILEELLEYDKTNEEVIKWLDKNYSGLIREVGLE